MWGVGSPIAVLMVEFENATYVVNEGDGTFAVCLVKRGETVLDFDVDISVIETDLPRGAEGVFSQFMHGRLYQYLRSLQVLS